MKTDIYPTFEMNVTNAELKSIKIFCSFLDDMLDYKEFDTVSVFEIIRGIAYDCDNFLKSKNFKINIEEEKENEIF